MDTNKYGWNITGEDLYVAGQKENKIEYMEQDSWQSKELRSSH